ncbi:uncharacterized protein LOC125370629 [Ricinus communis]|uniref:uncharacterized protein LOC125370629 n=1 Tax=Ricinus communis TaxID=3988 RepID=UPI00201A3162|nr:uncharacterized protein LOC125370629 [Ricinus communis]
MHPYPPIIKVKGKKRLIFISWETGKTPMSLEEDLKISKKEIASLKTSNEDLKKSLDEISNEKLFKENNSLKNEVEKLRNSISKFHKGKESFDTLVVYQRAPFVRNELRFNEASSSTSHNIIFVQATQPQAFERNSNVYLKSTSTIFGMLIVDVQGNKVTFDSNGCLVNTLVDDKVIFKGERSGNTYTIDLHKVANQSFKCLVSISDESWLWHRRLRHASMELLYKIVKEELVNGLPKSIPHQAKPIESMNVVFDESNKLDLGEGVCVNDIVGALEELKVDVDDPSKGANKSIKEIQEDQQNQDATQDP